MSTVHLAFDRRLERRVAVKLLAEHLADDPAFVSRFQREAQAAARLVHPNIVQVFDSGRDERSGQYFIVMEYIEGSLLRGDPPRRRLDGGRRGRRRSSSRPARAWTTRTATGSSTATSSPATCCARARAWSSWPTSGSPRRPSSRASPRSARSSGRPPTWPPSRLAARRPAPQADLYALGVVAYQLISGRLPYEAASLTELALKQQQEVPASPRHAGGGRHARSWPRRSRSPWPSTRAIATSPRARWRRAIADGAQRHRPPVRSDGPRAGPSRPQATSLLGHARAR